MIRVKLFAVLRDAAGASELSLELAPGATVSAAVAEIGRQYSALARHLPRAAAAVNLARVSAETVLHDGDELALLPPVSGG